MPPTSVSSASATRREISGYFVNPEKWQQHMDALTAADSAVTEVRLFHNEPSHTTALITALQQNSSVTSLDTYELDPNSAELLAAYLEATQQLKSLTIHHMHGVAAAELVATGLKANTTLAHINFSNLDSDSVVAVASALAARSQPLHLEQLRLNQCQLNCHSSTSLATAVGCNGKWLRLLQLSDDQLNDESTGQLLGSVGLSSLCSLVELDLRNNSISVTGAQLLGQYLASSPCLQVLHLCNNQMDDRAAHALAAGFAANRSLQVVDLSDNNIGSVGTAAVAESLQANSSIQSLDLSRNPVGASGFAHLLVALSVNQGLHKLLLQKCNIDGSGVLSALQLVIETRNKVALMDSDSEPAHVLVPRVAAPLEHLNVSDSCLTDVGTQALLQALSGGTTLKHLDLCGCGFGDASMQALVGFVEKQLQLEALLLERNRLHNAAAQHLFTAVQAHPSLWNVRWEGNKLTDPLLKSTLSEHSQLLLARHSQEVHKGHRMFASEAYTIPPHRLADAEQAHGLLGVNSGSGLHLRFDDTRNNSGMQMDLSPNSAFLPSAFAEAVGSHGRCSTDSEGGLSAFFGCSARDAEHSSLSNTTFRFLVSTNSSCTGSGDFGSSLSSSQAACLVRPLAANDSGKVGRTQGSELQRHPLSAKRPKYKPLTPEQQKMFDDF